MRRNPGVRQGNLEDTNVRKLYFVVITALLMAPAAVADTGTGVEAFKTKQFAKALKELNPRVRTAAQ